MKKYKITIEETVADTFEVTAGSEEEALRVAERKYKEGEFVLEPGELTDVNFFADKDNTLTTHLKNDIILSKK